eukprot:COSAG01_NODE_58108_length_308_cov_0.732057_1_plen_85_part_10
MAAPKDGDKWGSPSDLKSRAISKSAGAHTHVGVLCAGVIIKQPRRDILVAAGYVLRNLWEQRRRHAIPSDAHTTTRKSTTGRSTR